MLGLALTVFATSFTTALRRVTMVLMDILVNYGLVVHGGLGEQRRAFNEVKNT